MEFLQQIEPGTLLLIVVGCCVGGVVLAILLPIISAVVGLVIDLTGVFVDILGGGPSSWCGCLVGLVLCAGCALTAAFVVSVLNTCGTPQAVNFCTLLGR